MFSFLLLLLLLLHYIICPLEFIVNRFYYTHMYLPYSLCYMSLLYGTFLWFRCTAPFLTLTRLPAFSFVVLIAYSCFWAWCIGMWSKDKWYGWKSRKLMIRNDCKAYFKGKEGQTLWTKKHIRGQGIFGLNWQQLHKLYLNSIRTMGEK